MTTNTMQLIMLVVIGLIIVIVTIPQFRESRRRLAVFWARKCQGREWRQQFPEAPKEDIRKFLSLLTDSFGFKKENRLKFRPTDTIKGIYTAIYPQEGWPDALEMEDFVDELEKKYGCKVTKEWKIWDCSLGEIFNKTRSQQSSAP